MAKKLFNDYVAMPISKDYSQWDFNLGLTNPSAPIDAQAVEDIPVKDWATKGIYNFGIPESKTSIKSFKDNKEFVNTMSNEFSKALKKRGLSEEYTDYLVAQAALESAWGKKQSGTHNYSGIKLPSNMKGKGLGSVKNTKEEINGVLQNTKDEFRNFDSIENFVNFKVDFLNNNRYNAFSGDFIKNVVAGGYATDSKYGNKLKQITETVKKIKNGKTN